MSKQAELQQWLASMGVGQQFGREDLQSGRTVASIVRVVGREGKIQLQEGNSAMVRVSNWNIILEYLKQVGIKITQQEKGKIINGNHDLVFKIISKLRQMHQRSSKETEINLKDIDPKKDVKDAESLLELFLLAIIKHFSLSPKEALSLLSNDCKYLAHILAKGLKGDFRPIDNLVLEFGRNMQKIVNFAKNKENEVFFMKSIKPALISKSESVSENTLNLLIGFLQNFDHQARLAMVSEHLSATLMLIVRRHPQLIDKVVTNLLELTDYDETVLADMYKNTSKNEVCALFMSVWRVFARRGMKRELIENEVFLRMVDQISRGFEDPDMVLASLRCATELALEDFDAFDRCFAEKLIMVVREILLSKETQNLELVHIYFCLMERTGQEKHPLAPVIYKLLVSRLSNAGENEYEALVAGFQQLADDLPSIPLTPVIQTLMQRGEFKVEQLEIGLFGRALASGTAEARVAVAIYNLVSRTFVEETGFGRELVLVLMQIMRAFKEEDILTDMTGKLVKVCLALYFANAKKMAQKRKPLSYKSKTDGGQATTKLKMLEIEFFLRMVIRSGDKELIAGAEPLLCFSVLQLEALGKEHSRGLERVVGLLGDAAKLLAKYEKELNSVDEVQVQGQGQKKSRVHHSPEGTPSSELEGNTSEGVSQYERSPKQRLQNSHPLHPLSLSMAAVKTDAYLGLQKYSKRHQVKALAVESKRYQMIQAAEDLVKQKKVMQRKVAIEKGMKLKGVAETEIAYLFEFDSKEVFIESNQLYLNYYSTEAEEERDAQGVEQAVRRYEKALKVYFKEYCGKKIGFHTKNFDEILDRANHLHTSAIFKMLKDHGMETYITPREIKIMARKVNYKKGSTKDDPELLDFEGFKEMVIQMSFTMFTRPPKDLRGRPVAEMMEEFFSMVKLYATDNKFNVQLFEQPEACFGGEQEAVSLLNKRLQQNSDYILPEGYKKITETRTIYDHKIYLQALGETYKDVYEVLDQILFEGMNLHIIEPFTQEVKFSRARPNVYSLDYTKMNEIETKHLPVYMKKEVAKYPMKERQLAKEAGMVLADIVRAVELNHDDIGLKHDNPYVKGKKEALQELQRTKEEHEMKRLNATRLMRSAVDTFKDKKDDRDKKVEEKREEELKKKREKEERKERREKELKEKLEEYNQKKKEDEETRREGEKARQERLKADADRKKADLEETKRKIEERKKEKEEEENQRKQRENQQKQAKKQEDKRRYDRDQAERKKKISEYKARKKGEVSKVMDAGEQKGEQQQQNKE